VASLITSEVEHRARRPSLARRRLMQTSLSRIARSAVRFARSQSCAGQMMARPFDADNRLVAESTPATIDVPKGQDTTSAWSLPMVSVAGTYRADVFLDGHARLAWLVGMTPLPTPGQRRRDGESTWAVDTLFIESLARSVRPRSPSSPSIGSS